MTFGCVIIEEKIRLMIFFQFSVSVIELEFQPIGFLARHFFITFIRTLTQMLILTLFSRILDGLTKKTINAVRFSIIKIRMLVICMHLRSKLTSEICQEIGNSDEKTEQNSLKVPTFHLFSKNHCIY